MATVLINQRCDNEFYPNCVVKTYRAQYGYIHISVSTKVCSVDWTRRRKQKNCEELFYFRHGGEEKSGFNRCVEFIGTSQFRFKKREKRKMFGVRDSQRKKVYAWEAVNLDLNNQPTLTANQMTDFVKMVANDNDLVLRKLSYRSGGRASFARGSGELQFLPSHMNKVIACHEIAHLVTYKVHGDYKVAGHGPEWVRIYVEMLVKYCGIDRKMLMNTLKMSRIKIA